MTLSAQTTIAGRAVMATPAPAPILRVAGLLVAYGGIQAVKGIDLEIHPGELIALIGANGAGKTTSLRAITGSQAWGGTVEYFGRSTRGVPSHAQLSRALRW